MKTIQELKLEAYDQTIFEIERKIEYAMREGKHTALVFTKFLTDDIKNTLIIEGFTLKEHPNKPIEITIIEWSD